LKEEKQQKREYSLQDGLKWSIIRLIDKFRVQAAKEERELEDLQKTVTAIYGKAFNMCR
jgi:hypothetical protein